MKPVLIHLSPIDKSTGERTSIRVADTSSGEAYGAPGGPWLPALASRPELSIELFSKKLDGKVQAARARFSVRMAGLGTRRRLAWRGAPVFIRVDDQLAGQSALPDFIGHVREETLDRASGILTLQCEVSANRLNGPILSRTFGGGGGIDGDPGRRGMYWPAGFGTVFNIEPIWFDEVRNIGTIDGYGNTLTIDWLGEGLSSFGPSVGDYGSYQALADAIDLKHIKPGQWATCISEGLVGLGAPPVGVITVHATFGQDRIGALIRRLLLLHAKIAIEDIDLAALTVLDEEVDRPIGYWLSSQRSVRDLVEALARSAIATPLINFRGIFTITRAVASAPQADLVLDGSGLPRVLGVVEQSSDAPVSRISARTAVPARVLTNQEVNYKDTIEDRGDWSETVEYRLGNLVWLRDGSSYLYINDTPSTGHDPRDIPNEDQQDAWWARQRKPLTPADLTTYADGTPIEELKPATAGATAGAPNGTTVGGVVNPITNDVEGGLPSEEVVDAVTPDILAAADKPAFRIEVQALWDRYTRLFQRLQDENLAEIAPIASAHAIALSSRDALTLFVEGIDPSYLDDTQPSPIERQQYDTIRETLTADLDKLQEAIAKYGVRAPDLLDAPLTLTDLDYSTAAAIAEAKRQLTATGADGKIARNVKASLYTERARLSVLNQRLFDYSGKFFAESNYPAITAARDAMVVKRDALTAYLDSLGPTYSNDNQLTDVDPTAWATAWSDLYDAMYALSGTLGYPASDTLGDLVADNYLYPYQKRATETEYIRIAARHTQLVGRAQPLPVDTTLLEARFDALQDWIEELNPPIDDYKVGNSITPGEWEMLVELYEAEYQAVLALCDQYVAEQQEVNTLTAREKATTFAATEQDLTQRNATLSAAAAPLLATQPALSAANTAATQARTAYLSWRGQQSPPVDGAGAELSTTIVRTVYNDLVADWQDALNNLDVALYQATGLPLTPVLTNDSAQLPTNSAGTVTDYSAASGQMIVYLGNDALTADVAFSIQATGSASGTINATTGAYTVTSLTANAGWIDFKAVYRGTTLIKRITLSKILNGAAGAAGKFIKLSASRVVITYSAAGSPSPLPQDTVFTITRTNLTAGNAANWFMRDLDNNILSASSYLTINGDTATMTAASFNTARGSSNGVRVYATVNDNGLLGDDVAVTRVSDGQQGVTGANGQYTFTVYQRSANQPTTPTATSQFPPGWTETPPTDNGLALWETSAQFRDGVRLPAGWSTPVRTLPGGLKPNADQTAGNYPMTTNIGLVSVDTTVGWYSPSNTYDTTSVAYANCKRYAGATDVSNSATWSVVATAGVTASINTAGQVTISAMVGSLGYIIATSTYEGLTLQELITLRKNYSTNTANISTITVLRNGRFLDVGPKQETSYITIFKAVSSPGSYLTGRLTFFARPGGLPGQQSSVFLSYRYRPLGTAGDGGWSEFGLGSSGGSVYDYINGTTRQANMQFWNINTQSASFTAEIELRAYVSNPLVVVEAPFVYLVLVA